MLLIELLHSLALPRLYGKITGNHLHHDRLIATLDRKPNLALLVKDVTWRLLFEVFQVLTGAETGDYYSATRQAAFFDKQIGVLRRFPNMQKLRCQVWITGAKNRLPLDLATLNLTSRPYPIANHLIGWDVICPETVSCLTVIHQERSFGYEPLLPDFLPLPWDLARMLNSSQKIKHLAFDAGSLEAALGRSSPPSFSTYLSGGGWEGIESLDLSCGGFGEEELRAMGRVVKDFPQLANLRISYDHLCSADVDINFEISCAYNFQNEGDITYIQTATQLTSLSLSALDMGTYSLPHSLASCFPSLRNLALDFRKYDGTKKPLESLQELLAALFPLESVSSNLVNVFIYCRDAYDFILKDDISGRDLFSVFKNRDICPRLSNFEFVCLSPAQNARYHAPTRALYWSKWEPMTEAGDLEELMHDAPQELLFTYRFIQWTVTQQYVETEALRCRAGEQATTFTQAYSTFR